MLGQYLTHILRSTFVLVRVWISARGLAQNNLYSVDFFFFSVQHCLFARSFALEPSQRSTLILGLPLGAREPFSTLLLLTCSTAAVASADIDFRGYIDSA